MATIKRRTSKAAEKPVAVEGLDAFDVKLYLKQPTLRFVERAVQANITELETLPIIDVLTWAFLDGAICDENGDVFENVTCKDDVVALFENGTEGLVLFAAVMERFRNAIKGSSIVPKPQRKVATRKK